MAEPFLALITPLSSGGVPTHPIAPGGPPPGIWPDPGHPAHPIVIPPDAIAPGVPTHPIYLPPVIWPSPGHPAHPIVLPPGSIGPGLPTHPIVLPPPAHPSHPIVIPPGAIAPGVPTHPIVLPPLGIWGGAPPYVDIGGPSPQPRPEHPIAPGGPPPGIWPSPGHPDNSLPLPPTMVPPEVPPELESMAIALTKLPGQDWVLRTATVGPDHSLPPFASQLPT